MSVTVLGENAGRVKSMRLFLDGAEITPLCRVFGPNMKFFPDREIASGGHALEAEVMLDDGITIREKSEFTVSVMGEDEY